MLPPALQFELRPRRHRSWLRIVLGVVCAIVACSMALGWWQQQKEIERLTREADSIRAQLTSGTPIPAASRPRAAWADAAVEDGRLFRLDADARLLEIERCTVDRGGVTHLVHDGVTLITRIELTMASSQELAALLSCLNEGATRDRRWRLVSADSPHASDRHVKAVLSHD